ncbi:MAG: prolyl oligopeptidase family serine peptidase, partial [Pseudomonadota bacterium]
VVKIDGMGTPDRSKAFREVSYGKLLVESGGIEDHVIGLKELGERFPELDLMRVGIYGHSGGGYASVRAMLAYPDFYKVTVSGAAAHDQRIYHAGWGERYQGYPNGDNYDGQSNTDYAENLNGKLLMIHGGLDDNVHPGHTLTFVQSLIDQNKDFDLLVIPDADHDFRLHPYAVRRRWDYFVEHLQGVEPPSGIDLADKD